LPDAGALSVRDTCRLRTCAGSALNLVHRGREAIKTLTVAQRLAGEIGDEPLARAADYQLAVATRIAGNPRGAREMLEVLLRRVERAKPPDQLLRLRVLITLGGCAHDLGEPQAGLGPRAAPVAARVARRRRGGARPGGRRRRGAGPRCRPRRRGAAPRPAAVAAPQRGRRRWGCGRTPRGGLRGGCVGWRPS